MIRSRLTTIEAISAKSSSYIGLFGKLSQWGIVAATGTQFDPGRTGTSFWNSTYDVSRRAVYTSAETIDLRCKEEKRSYSAEEPDVRTTAEALDR